MSFFAAILNCNFRLQTSDFRFQISEVPTALVDRYIFVCQMESHSEYPVHTLTYISDDLKLYHYPRH